MYNNDIIPPFLLSLSLSFWRCSLFLVEENELVAVVFDSELPEEAVSFDGLISACIHACTHLIIVTSDWQFFFKFILLDCPLLSSLLPLSPFPQTPGSSAQIRIPIGQGIAGFVAQSGKSVNIRDAYKSQYFYKEVDKTTGFVTRYIYWLYNSKKFKKNFFFRILSHNLSPCFTSILSDQIFKINLMVHVLFIFNFFRNVLCIPIIDHTGGECLHTVQLEK